MDTNAPPPELNAINNRSSITTLWPQFLSGSCAVAAVIWAIFSGTVTSVAIAVGAVALFAIVTGYLWTMLRGNYAAMRLLTWAGGFFLALYTIALSHQLLPAAALFIVSVAGYALSVSDRRVMRLGLMTAFGVLCIVVILSELGKRGIFDLGLDLSPAVLTAVNVLMVLGVGADVLHRYMRSFDRIEASVYSVQRSNSALESARSELETQLNERTRLLDVTRTVSSTLDLQTLLDSTLTQLKMLIDCDYADIFLLTRTEIPALVSHGSVPDSAVLLNSRPAYARVVTSCVPLVVSDCAASQQLGLPNVAGSWLGIPLIVRGAAIGLLSITSAKTSQFEARDTELALAFANQVAGLIQNGRLRNEAAQSAALAERNRLARDLHDSVTQSLFGIGLGIRTVEQEMLNSHERANKALEYTRQLADNAMTEMRALIFTLRPESLTNEGIYGALSKHIESLKLRFEIPITLSRCGEEPDLAPEAKEAVYRIALEAIQNALKHAQPKAIHISFDCEPDRVAVVIRDEGRGFDVSVTQSGRLGLQSMRERAQDLGGVTTISSTPEVGTIVRAEVPVRRA